VAEILVLPEQDRAFLARQLIASLNETVDAMPNHSGTKSLTAAHASRRQNHLHSDQAVPQKMRHKFHKRSL
jgi:hypothetical protein